MARLPPAALRKKRFRTAKSMKDNQNSKKNEDHPASTKAEQPRRPNRYQSVSKIFSASSTMMSKVDANAKILGIAYSANKFGIKNTFKRLSDSYVFHDNEDKLKKMGEAFDPEVVLTEILFVVRNLQELAKIETENNPLPHASRLPWVRKETTRDPSSQPANQDTDKANPTQGTVDEPKEHPAYQPANEANPHVEPHEREENTDEPNESDEDGFLPSAWRIICNFFSGWFDD